MNDVTREEILELVKLFVDLPDRNDQISVYINTLYPLRARAKSAEANNTQLARHRRTDDLDAKSQALVASLRETLARQDAEIANLKKELKEAYRNNEKRNLELDALHYVWCDGGCPSGTHRFDGQGPKGVTEEIVKAAERNTRRLQRWWHTREYRRLLGQDLG